MKMTKETYCLPIKIEVKSEEPDVMMREIAESIYDAINAWALTSITLQSGRTIDVQWSIYKKQDPETFGM